MKSAGTAVRTLPSEEIKVAMMTTRMQNGMLRSRPMANQKQARGADLWFVTS